MEKPTTDKKKKGQPMNCPSRNQRIVNYVREHKVSLGILLAGYGAFYLAIVIMGNWTLTDWGTDTTGLPTNVVQPLLPREYIAPLFFTTSFPALLIGTVMLCAYSLRGLFLEAKGDKEHVAILLTASGFAYVVVGAWPLQKLADFAWEWQKQIMSYGSAFAWMLYLLSVAVLVVGVFSLFVHSRRYHREHPELSIN